jgi:hypothetical protein
MLLGFAGVNLGRYRSLNPFGRYKLDGDVTCASASGELSTARSAGWDAGLVVGELLDLSRSSLKTRDTRRFERAIIRWRLVKLTSN